MSFYCSFSIVVTILINKYVRPMGQNGTPNRNPLIRAAALAFMNPLGLCNDSPM